MIDVIMPCYNPDKELLLRALDSLRKQTYKDFIITIVNDCGSSEFENWLPEDLNIRVLNREINGGCGMARQMGIDNTDCEWFMFLDCDDMLSDKALEILINKSENADMVESVFWQQTSDTDGFPITPGKRSIWMHGKLYNTSFIRKYDIHFYDGIRYNEDYGFNLLVREYANRIKQINSSTYFWMMNQNSVTRTSGLSDYSLHNSEQQVAVLCKSIKHLTNNKITKTDYVNLIAIIYNLYQYSKNLECDFIDRKELKEILSNKIVINSFKNKDNLKGLSILKQYKEIQNIPVFFTQTFIDWLLEFNAKDILKILIKSQGELK